MHWIKSWVPKGSPDSVLLQVLLQKYSLLHSLSTAQNCKHLKIKDNHWPFYSLFYSFFIYLKNNFHFFLLLLQILQISLRVSPRLFYILRIVRVMQIVGPAYSLLLSRSILLVTLCISVSQSSLVWLLHFLLKFLLSFLLLSVSLPSKHYRLPI